MQVEKKSREKYIDLLASLLDNAQVIFTLFKMPKHLILHDSFFGNCHYFTMWIWINWSWIAITSCRLGIFNPQQSTKRLNNARNEHVDTTYLKLNIEHKINKNGCQSTTATKKNRAQSNQRMKLLKSIFALEMKT